MRTWLWVAMAGTFLGTAHAQDASGPIQLAQVATKPAPSRFYGTARPSGPGPGGGGAPPVVVSPGRPVGPAPVYGGGGYYQGPVYVAPRPSVGVGVVIGSPWPYYYGRPYGYGYPYGYPYGYGYPPSVIVTQPPPPTVYIERPVETEAPRAGYWYWCAEPEGWYPQVSACSGGWQPVPPRAAAQ